MSNRPLRKSKVIEAVKDVRGGKMNDANFGSRMHGEGPRAQQLAQVFEIYSRKYKLNERSFRLNAKHFKRPAKASATADNQLSFDF